MDRGSVEEVMRVHTRFYAFLREKVGRSEDTLELEEGATIADFLKQISEKYGEIVGRDIFDEDGSLRSGFAVALNGENVRREEWGTTKLKDGDLVVILPPIAGGLAI